MLTDIDDALMAIKYSFQLGTFRAVNGVIQTAVLFHWDIRSRLVYNVVGLLLRT